MTNKTNHRVGYPIILSAVTMALFLVIVIIIYPGISPYSVHYSAETADVQAADNAPRQDSPSSAAAMMMQPVAQAQPPMAEDPWLNGFPYRKPISIAGSTSDLTQFQVNVTPYIYNETGLVGSWHFSETGRRP